jgi:hypothetical protein
MQWLMRIVCIGYAIFLTLLLLTSDPTRLIAVRGGLPWILRTMLPWAHMISFLVFAVFALVPRWPVPRWAIVILLAVYGGMTEVVQGFLPPRTPEWADWFQDLTGIAAGAAFCWAVAVLAGACVGVKRRQTEAASLVSDEWTMLQKGARRSAVGGRSWWN